LLALRCSGQEFVCGEETFNGRQRLSKNGKLDLICFVVEPSACSFAQDSRSSLSIWLQLDTRLNSHSMRTLPRADKIDWLINAKLAKQQEQTLTDTPLHLPLRFLVPCSATETSLQRKTGSLTKEPGPPSLSNEKTLLIRAPKRWRQL